jgi:hypothetical protein
VPRPGLLGRACAAPFIRSHRARQPTSRHLGQVASLQPPSSRPSRIPPTAVISTERSERRDPRILSSLLPLFLLVILTRRARISVVALRVFNLSVPPEESEPPYFQALKARHIPAWAGGPGKRSPVKTRGLKARYIVGIADYQQTLEDNEPALKGTASAVPQQSPWNEALATEVTARRPRPPPRRHGPLRRLPAPPSNRHPPPTRRPLPRHARHGKVLSRPLLRIRVPRPGLLGRACAAPFIRSHRARQSTSRHLGQVASLQPPSSRPSAASGEIPAFCLRCCPCFCSSF